MENRDRSSATPIVPLNPPVRACDRWHVTPGTLGSSKALTQILSSAHTRQVVLTQPISSASAALAMGKQNIIIVIIHLTRVIHLPSAGVLPLIILPVHHLAVFTQHSVVAHIFGSPVDDEGIPYIIVHTDFSRRTRPKRTASEPCCRCGDDRTPAASSRSHPWASYRSR